MPTISPSLWFDGNAEEAVGCYTSIFEDSRVLEVSRFGADGPGPEGSVLAMDFELLGRRYNAINGGPQFPFTEAISLLVSCESQQEVDRYWDALVIGGHEVQCGWLKDRFGLSWQIVPTRLGELMSDTDPERSARVMAAMLQMIKLDVAELERAAAG